MNESWKNDPRLKGMDPEKLALLQSFAKELQEAPDSQKMTVFLSVSQKASRQKIAFSPGERELIISILTEGMSPEEKKRVQLIRDLASKLPKNGR